MQDESCVISEYSISINKSIIMKGIAIIFVVFAHVLNYCVGSNMNKCAKLLGVGGVWIFLILSGYGLFWIKKKNKSISFVW